MSVKRYDLVGDMDGNCNLNEARMELSDDGVYVKYSEHLLLEQKLTDMAVQLANAESKCRELGTENAHARERHVFIRALAVSILEHSGGRMDWRGAMEDATELLQTVDSVYAITPASDTFLAEVRAQGVERMIEVKQQQLDGMHPDTFAIGAVRDSIRRDIYELKVFAEILRQEADQ